MISGKRSSALRKRSTPKNSWRGVEACGLIQLREEGAGTGTFRENLRSECIERGKMSKQEMREETERLIREAMERKSVTVKQGETRITAICGKCGANNRVSAAPGQLRVPFTCRECGHEQKTF
jgi:transcription elongation factor Elf1